MWMTPDELLRQIDRYVQQHGTQKQAAKNLGVSQAYLCDVRKRRREPAGKLLEAFGLRRLVVYEGTGRVRQ